MKKDLTGYYCFTHGHNWSVIESFNQKIVIAECKNCGKQEIISVNGDKTLYLSWALSDKEIIFI